MLVQRLHNELAKPSNPQDLSNNTRPFFNYSNGFSYANYEFPQDTTDRDHEWEEYLFVEINFFITYAEYTES